MSTNKIDTITQAYEEGREAFSAGHQTTDNPYLTIPYGYSPSGEAWLRGYEAQQRAEEEGIPSSDWHEPDEDDGDRYNLEQIERDRKEEGKEAFFNGEDGSSNPYALFSLEGEAWQLGYDEAAWEEKERSVPKYTPKPGDFSRLIRAKLDIFAPPEQWDMVLEAFQAIEKVKALIAESVYNQSLDGLEEALRLLEDL